MKTKIFVGSGLFSLVVVYILVAKLPLDEQGDMAQFVPETAVAFLLQNEPQNAIEKFKDSKFIKTLEKVNFPKTIREVGGPDQLVDIFEALKKNYSILKNNTVLHKLLGKKIGIALFPPEKGVYTTATEYIQKCSITIIHPNLSTNFLENLPGVSSPLQSDSSIQKVQYGAHNIIRYKTNSWQFSFAYINGCIIISHNERLLRECIDTYDSKEKNYATNQVYRSLKNQATNCNTFFYLNLEELRRLRLQYTNNCIFSHMDIFCKYMKKTTGFQALAYSDFPSENKTTDRIVLKFDPELVNNIVKRYIHISPQKSPVDRLITENTIGYYWSNTLNLHSLSRYVQQESEGNKNNKTENRFSTFFQYITDFTGKSLIQLQQLIGEEISIIVEPGQNDSYIPFPLVAMFFQAYEVEEIQRLLFAIIHQYNIPLTRVEYGPAYYYYWSFAPQDGFRPLYGFWDDMFFASNSSSLVHKIVDKSFTDSHLVNTHPLIAENIGLYTKNNSVTYSDNMQLVSIVKEFLYIFTTMVKIEDIDTAKRLRKIVKEIIEPVLDGLTMYVSSTSRSYFTQDSVVIDSVSQLDIQNMAKEKDHAKTRR